MCLSTAVSIILSTEQQSWFILSLLIDLRFVLSLPTDRPDRFFQTLAYNVFLCLGVLQFVNGGMKRRKSLQCAIKTRQNNSSESLSRS